MRTRMPPSGKDGRTRRERKHGMQRIALDAEAGQVSAELVHVLVEVASEEDLPMAAIAQAGRGLDWLAEEPDLYTDADLVPRTG
jgi:hypothetical protein